MNRSQILERAIQRAVATSADLLAALPGADPHTATAISNARKVCGQLAVALRTARVRDDDHADGLAIGTDRNRIVRGETFAIVAAPDARSINITDTRKTLHWSPDDRSTTRIPHESMATLIARAKVIK